MEKDGSPPIIYLNRFPLWIQAFLFGFAYFVCALTGDWVCFQPNQFVSFWLPSGLFVSTLLIHPKRFWPIFILAAFPANLAFDAWHSRPMEMSFLFCCGNCLEAFTGAWLVRFFIKKCPDLSSPKEVVVFTFLSALFSTTLSASIGVATIAWLGNNPNIGTTWLLWWSGDAVGILVLAPFIISWMTRKSIPQLKPARIAETVIVTTGLVVAVVIIIPADFAHRIASKYLIFLFLLWAAFRFGLRGTSVFSLLLAILGAWVASHLADTTVFNLSQFVNFQLFLGVASFTSLILVASLDQRQKAEKYLREVQQRLQMAIHGGNIGLWDWNLCTNETYFSSEWKRQIGYEEDEISNRYEEWQNRLHPDDYDQTLTTISEFQKQIRSNYEVEFRLRHKDGSYRWILARATIQTGSDGKPERMVGCHVDITERKKIEAELREARDYLDKLINYTCTPIVVWDNTFRITRFNTAFERLTGYKESEVINQNLKIFFQVENQEESVQKIKRTLNGKFWETVEIPIQRKDGMTRTVLWNSANILDNDGNTIIATISQGVDITERIRLEGQLAQAQKMESVGRLAGGVAHDFNNILTVILGYSEIMRDDLPSDSPLQESLTDILTATGRAKDLTKQLLAFSRKQVLEFHTININDVVKNVEKMISRLLGEDIEIRIHINPGIGLINADTSQIEQAILNLCVNSRDAMPDGGTLIIETNSAILDEHYIENHQGVKPGHYILLSVSDNGCGMDEKTRLQIFDPFFTTKERGKGTGLGLATVFGIVKQHGGEIWVYSEPGCGSTFKIYLPEVKTILPGRVSYSEENKIRGNGEIILVIEDENAVRKLSCEILNRLGYTVVEAKTTWDCIESAKKIKRIDLLLSDVIMPGMNGRQIKDVITTLHPETKTLFMSGYTENVIAHHGILDEGINFIAKPFSESALSQKVREVLYGNA